MHCLRPCLHACVKIVLIYYVFLQCRIVQQMSTKIVLDRKAYPADNVRAT